MGVRPFYYYHDQYFFAFSSCKQGLLAIPELDKSINNEYLINQVIKSKQKPISTFFKKIKRLLPAHTLVVNKDGSRERKYWTLNIQKETKFKKEEDYVLAFQENLAEAVQCRLRSHKNVGMELSGGLDSSGIAAFAYPLLKKTGKELFAFVNAMDDEKRKLYYPYSDESPEFNAVCNHLGIKEKHLITQSLPRTFTELSDHKLNLHGGPDDYYGTDNDAIRYAANQKNVGVILSGFPGDELITDNCISVYMDYLHEGKLVDFFLFARRFRIKKFERLWLIITQLFPKLGDTYKSVSYTHLTLPTKA